LAHDAERVVSGLIDRRAGLLVYNRPSLNPASQRDRRAHDGAVSAWRRLQGALPHGCGGRGLPRSSRRTLRQPERKRSCTRAWKRHQRRGQHSGISPLLPVESSDG
jgi:hypothetical protein